MWSSIGASGRPRAVPRAALSLLAALSFVLVGCSSGSNEGAASGEPLSEAQQGLYEEAVNAGGQLRVFIGSSGNQELDAVKETFGAQFPDIDLSFINGTSDQVQERFLNEKRAGLNNADVVSLGGIAPFEQINEEGYLAQFTPEDADLFSYDPNGFIPGLAYGFADINMGVCYNPTKLSDEEVELLQTYEGWTDPRFEGRAAIVSPDGYGYRRGLTNWVYENSALGEPWLRQIAKLDPTVFPNANAAAPQVIAGEYDVLFNSLTLMAARAADDGAPLRCAAPSPTPTYPFSAGLVKDAPNSAAGQLFINWLLSENGQQAVQDTFAYNARREGFDAPVIDEEWWQTPKDVRIVNEQAVVANQQDLTALFSGLFGGAS